MKKILFVLPILAMCLAACEKPAGENENDTETPELTGDDIIPFEDKNFLEALLNIEGIDANQDGQISVDDLVLSLFKQMRLYS